ncbi:MAG: hypothetical protein ACK55Z_34365, partial [bacterium]
MFLTDSLYNGQHSLLPATLFGLLDCIGIGDGGRLQVGLGGSRELLVVVSVHPADSRGGVIFIQHALGGKLGIGIGSILVA